MEEAQILAKGATLVIPSLYLEEIPMMKQESMKHQEEVLVRELKGAE